MELKDRGEIAAWEDPEVLGCIDIYRCAALRGKIRPDEAEAEDCGGSTFEADNEVWPDFNRNPKGRGHFPSFLRQSSLADTRYASLLFPRTEKKWLPSLCAGICRYTLAPLHFRPLIGNAGPAKRLCLFGTGLRIVNVLYSSRDLTCQGKKPCY
jgi:hypothetical protein